MRAWTVAVIAALGVAGAWPAVAAPAVSTKYIYYKVSGDSAAGLYSSMIRRGPHVNGSKAYAATSAESAQTGKLEQTGSCRVRDYQYSISFVIRLPQLNNERALPANVRSRWRQFSAFLKTHEETHRAIWIGCAKEIETKVKSLRARTCDQVDEQAARVRDQIQNSCNKKHMAFDNAEQRRLSKHPFVKMVLNRPQKLTKTAVIVQKKRKKAAALAN